MSYGNSITELLSCDGTGVEDLVTPLIRQEGSPVVSKLPPQGESREAVVVRRRIHAQRARLQLLIVREAERRMPCVVPAQLALQFHARQSGLRAGEKPRAARVVSLEAQRRRRHVKLVSQRESPGHRKTVSISHNRILDSRPLRTGADNQVHPA